MSELPLEGVRVLDLSRLLPGPFATLQLADLGAEVIKVESPTRPDYLRFLEPYVEDQNVAFRLVNRGKKSVVVNFETEAGAALVRRLAGTCQVVIESFRAGFLARFGLDYAGLADPGLVYCSLTAYGQFTARAAHDLNTLALTGLSDLLRGPQGPVVPKVQLADITGGLAAANAILAALVARARTGKGRYLDVSMADAAYHLTLLSSESARHGIDSFHGGALDGRARFYRYYPCADGKWLAVGAMEDKFQNLLVEALGSDDPGPVLASRERAHWVEVLGPLDACVEPVLSAEEVLDSDWFRQRFPSDHLPGLLEASYPGRGGAACPPGAHTAEELSRIGVGEAEFESLLAEGVVAG